MAFRRQQQRRTPQHAFPSQSGGNGSSPGPSLGRTIIDVTQDNDGGPSSSAVVRLDGPLTDATNPASWAGFNIASALAISIVDLGGDAYDLTFGSLFDFGDIWETTANTPQLLAFPQNGHVLNP